MPSRDQGPRRHQPGPDRASPRRGANRSLDAALPANSTSPSSRRPPSALRPSAPHDKPPRHPSNTDSASSDASSGTRPRRVRVALPEMDRRGLDSRSSSVPYPSFSKAHSREAVRSTDNVPLKDPVTPQATELSNSPSATGSATATAEASGPAPGPGRPPPSPPLTAVDAPDLRRAGSGNSMKQAASDAKASHARRKSADNDTLYSLRRAEEGASGLKVAQPKPTSASRSSLRSMFQGRSSLASGKKMPLNNTPLKKSRSTADSDAAPIPDRRSKPSTRDRANSSDSGTEPAKQPHASSATSRKSHRPTIDVESLMSHDDRDANLHVGLPQTPSVTTAVPPPPPPPPATATTHVPRVDYLLQNGGLGRLVPKDFGSAVSSLRPQQYNQYMSPRPGAPRSVDVSATFDPFHSLLDNYSTVLSKSGSIAVATGYRSVARRLLDKLENVFSRNISSELCACVLCKSADHDTHATLEDTGVSWGEVLELVSGRQDLPPWPPFSLARSDNLGLGISALDQQAPMQKLDIDVPDEYREHYIRQSKKTKQAVDKWLANQPEAQPSPPQEVDDETLIFATLTYLEPGERRAFMALLRDLSRVPDSRAPTPARTPGAKSKVLMRTGIALQRLYRLSKSPREPESAIYLLKNKTLHNALATLAAITPQEWDILVSGRFNGFLSSGAEADEHDPSHQSVDDVNGHVAARTSSRMAETTSPSPLGMATPQGLLRNAPAGPVQLDEETEVAVLAEVEREIYSGMEALEDAFELLHSKAERVRSALQQRGAGMALQAQRRRALNGVERPQARMGTPALGVEAEASENGALAAPVNGEGGWRLDEDDGGVLDARSELVPDDSASNVGWREREKKGRYKKRRAGTSRREERRTPAPVEEEDEVDDPGPRRHKR